MFSSFLPQFGLDSTRQELEKMHDLWALRRPNDPRASARSPWSTAYPHESGISPSRWEQALGRMVIGREPADALEAEFAGDPGVRLTQTLVKEFRASMVVAVYRLSSRLLMLALGPDIFRAILEDFWSTTPPHQFAATEADAFADYLVAKKLRVPQLQSILAFERAALDTLRDNQPRIVRFNVDPLPMLQALADGILLNDPATPGDYEIELTPEDAVRISGITSEDTGGAIPFH